MRKPKKPLSNDTIKNVLDQHTNQLKQLTNKLTLCHQRITDKMDRHIQNHHPRKEPSIVGRVLACISLILLWIGLLAGHFILPNMLTTCVSIIAAIITVGIVVIILIELAGLGD